MVVLSFLRLRKTQPEMNRSFKVSHGNVVGRLAFLMAMIMVLLYLIPTTNCSLLWQEWLIVGGWGILGVLMARRAMRLYKDKFCSGMSKLV